MNLGGKEVGWFKRKTSFCLDIRSFHSEYPAWMMLLLQGRFSMGPFGTWFDGACWLLMGSIDLHSSVSSPPHPSSLSSVGSSKWQTTNNKSIPGSCCSPCCHHHRSGFRWWRKQITPGLIHPKCEVISNNFEKNIYLKSNFRSLFRTAQIKENNPKLPQKVQKSPPGSAGQEKEPQEIHCEKGEEADLPPRSGMGRKVSPDECCSN